jgi:hypothetical protein
VRFSFVAKTRMVRPERASLLRLGAVEHVVMGAIQCSARVGLVIGHEPLHRCVHIARGEVSLCLAYIHARIAKVGKDRLETGCLLGAVEHVVMG